jgi:FtsH-binding integral membrane protein
LFEATARGARAFRTWLASARLGRRNGILAPLLGGGIPLFAGLIFAPVGIYYVAQGDPQTESLGWIFASVGAVSAFIGIVVAIVIWPDRSPSPDD